MTTIWCLWNTPKYKGWGGGGGRVLLGGGGAMQTLNSSEVYLGRELSSLATTISIGAVKHILGENSQISSPRFLRTCRSIGNEGGGGGVGCSTDEQLGRKD